MSRIQTGRDPFARRTIRKRKVYSDRNTCAWCGSFRNAPNGDRYLWQYYTEDDQGPRQSGDIPGLFCALDCLNTYHN